MYHIRVELNVIANVLNNSLFANRISESHTAVIDQHQATFKTLLDKGVALERKRTLLRQQGHLFMPTFLEIIGDQIKSLLPQHRNKKNCPLCDTKNLIKLSNHLKQIHNLTGDNRKRLLRQHFYRARPKTS